MRAKGVALAIPDELKRMLLLLSPGAYAGSFGEAMLEKMGLQLLLSAVHYSCA